MASIGLALAEGKRIYDVEKQRRAEMDTYKKEEGVRAATRAAGIASARAQQQEAEEFVAKDSKELRKLQRSAKKYLAQVSKIKSILSRDAQKDLLNNLSVLRKHDGALMSGDPKAVEAILAEMGLEGFTSEADPDGYENGLVLTHPNGATYKFDSPKHAQFKLSQLPVQNALRRTASVEAANVEAKAEAIKHMRELEKVSVEYEYKLRLEGMKDMADKLKLAKEMAMSEAGIVMDPDGNISYAEGTDPAVAWQDYGTRLKQVFTDMQDNPGYNVIAGHAKAELDRATEAGKAAIAEAKAVGAITGKAAGADRDTTTGPGLTKEEYAEREALKEEKAKELELTDPSKRRYAMSVAGPGKGLTKDTIGSEQELPLNPGVSSVQDPTYDPVFEAQLPEGSWIEGSSTPGTLSPQEAAAIANYNRFDPRTGQITRGI